MVLWSSYGEICDKCHVDAAINALKRFSRSTEFVTNDTNEAQANIIADANLP